MSKKRSDELQNNTEKNWADYTVNIHDGWADDVSLVYPEGSWRPDDEELTAISIADEEEEILEDADSGSDSLECDDSGETKKTVPQIKGTVDEQLEKVKMSKKKISGFLVFMICWVVVLSIAIGIFLMMFHDYLVKYEAAYQQSRPYHVMDDLMESFIEYDFNTLYGYMTMPPVINQFENRDDLSYFMYELLDGKKISYVKSENYTEDCPEYYVTADDYIVATVALRKSPVDSLDYDFPVWYVTNFEYYTEPQYNVRIKAPSDYVVTVNGVRLTEDYLISSVSDNNAWQYFGDNVELPNENKYEIDDFYRMPVVLATNSFGNEASVEFNNLTGYYEVTLGEDENINVLKQLAISAAEIYSNYVSHDLTKGEFESCFTDDATIVPIIEEAVATNFFANHKEYRFENEVVDNIEIYSSNAFCAEVTVDQIIVTDWGSEVSRTNHATYYFVRMADQWKICQIEF